MENTCNYSDNWQPYIGDYDKFEYDIKLKDGTIIENCYPNARKFNSISDQHDQKSFDEGDVDEIRFSDKPRYMLGNPFSEKKPDEEYVRLIDREIEHTRSAASELLSYPIIPMDPYYDIEKLMLNDNDLPIHKRRKKIRGTFVPVRTDPKIGRNTPCPCGSGLKYKKCCNGK